MPMEQVHLVEALAAHLGIEVIAAVLEPARLEDFIGGQGHLLDAVGELVGVPTVLRVAAVGVDAAEDPQRHGGGDLMMKTVPGQRRVVGLDVHFDFVFQAVLMQEAEHSGAVVIVLVLGRLLGLGLDQQVTRKADLVLVLHHHAHKTPELFALALEVGVEQGFITLTTTPQHIVGALEPQRGIHRAEHLGGGEGEHLWVWVARRPGGKARVAEAIGSAPQQLDAGLFLMALQVVDHLREVVAVLLERAAFGRHIGVVKAVVVDAQLGKKLKRRLGLADRHLHRIATALPRAFERPHPKHIRPRPHEGMPVTSRHAQVLPHGLAEDQLVGVVVTKREGRGAGRAFEAHLLDTGEVRHGVFLIVLGGVWILATAPGRLIMKITKV